MSKLSNDPAWVLTQQRNQSIADLVKKSWDKRMCAESESNYRVCYHVRLGLPWEYAYFSTPQLARAYFQTQVRGQGLLGAVQFRHKQFGWTE